MLFLLALGAAFLFFGATIVSGSTTLPSGVPVSVQADSPAGFGIGQESGLTTVTAGSRKIEMSDKWIKVDGAEVAVIDASIKELEISISGNEVTFSSGGEILAQIR